MTPEASEELQQVEGFGSDENLREENRLSGQSPFRLTERGPIVRMATKIGKASLLNPWYLGTSSILGVIVYLVQYWWSGKYATDKPVAWRCYKTTCRCQGHCRLDETSLHLTLKQSSIFCFGCFEVSQESLMVPGLDCGSTERSSMHRWLRRCKQLPMQATGHRFGSMLYFFRA